MMHKVSTGRELACIFMHLADAFSHSDKIGEKAFRHREATVFRIYNGRCIRQLDQEARGETQRTKKEAVWVKVGSTFSKRGAERVKGLESDFVPRCGGTTQALFVQ